MQSTNTPLPSDHARILRLAVGLVFGLAIAGMTQLTPHGYPDKTPLWAEIGISTLMLGAFILWAGAGVMRRINLAIWSVVALGLIALIAWTRAAHDTTSGFNPFFFNISFLIYPFLFISHELVASADQAGKWIAPYPLYNDEAWHRGVQLILAVVFTGLFWGILALGAVLLGFIGFHWFGDLLLKPWIGWPLSGLALGASVHLGDSQPKLMSGVRALVLGVLSWLLPVLTLIGLLFAVSLCFSGLAPLWKTKAASITLLGACVGLVLLINSAYQQGDEDRKVHIALKLSARVACGLLFAFASLAIYSLSIRITQYGLTPERVLALLGVIIAGLFGLGYVITAVWPKGRWLHLIEGVNTAMAVIMALSFLSVLTPVADPYRISVASQVARLQGSAVTPDKFDWKMLRFDSGDYGKAALADLVKTGKTEAIKTAAAKAKALKDDESYLIPQTVDTPPVKIDPKRVKLIAPKDGVLPASFLSQDFDRDSGETPPCLLDAKQTCQVVMIDLNDDGKPELTVLSDNQLIVLEDGAKGWHTTRGTIYLDAKGKAAFAAGHVSAVKPAWNDLMIGEDRQTLN